MHKIIFFLSLMSFISVLSINSVYAERYCESDLVCVKTGDYLRYKTSVGELLLEFEDELDNDMINFKWSSFNPDGSIDTENSYVLDRRSGNYTGDTKVFDSNVELPLLYIQRIPIKIPDQDDFCMETKYDYNKISRKVISCEMEDGSVKLIIDAETGVFLKINLQFTPILAKYELVDSNIFSTNKTLDISSKLTSNESIMKSIIPIWIKNNAGWWADGSIDDKSFIQGIQYLIKEKIISVSSTQSSGNGSDEIPSWIKNNAKWWAEGNISDDEFIKGIEYLVKTGIIHV